MSADLESPTSPDLKNSDGYLNEGGEEYLESNIDLDKSDNQLIS